MERCKFEREGCKVETDKGHWLIYMLLFFIIMDQLVYSYKIDEMKMKVNSLDSLMRIKIDNVNVRDSLKKEDERVRKEIMLIDSLKKLKNK